MEATGGSFPSSKAGSDRRELDVEAPAMTATLTAAARPGSRFSAESVAGLASREAKIASSGSLASEAVPAVRLSFNSEKLDKII
jgi:hypothetical protein